MAAEKSSAKGQAWFCTTGLPSDVVVDVDDMTFHLHKFPLMSKSKKLHDLISEQEAKQSLDGGDGGKVAAESEIEVESCHITLPEFPGGSETFELAAKFCYGVKIDISAASAAALRCAGEVLQMTEEYSEDNLISRADRFLSQSVSRSLKDSIRALKSCENLMPMAEELGIVQRCIDTISAKAALVDPSLFGWPVTESASRNSRDVDPWFEDLSVLCYDFFNRVLAAMKAQEVSSDVIESCLLNYAKKRFPGISRSSKKPARSPAVSSVASEAEQRELLESIVANLPIDNALISSRSTRILFGMLRTANILSASDRCKSVLERKIGAQLDQATLDDLLIPSYSYLIETLYDVDCVERILAYFLENYQERSGERSPSLMLVGKLIDGYLSEIASDANLKPDKFCNLALCLPDHARLFDDGLYRSVDVYLKAHPWISESERERICGAMDCRKLTLEACTHAAQNERLPLRSVVQVLFFEQLQLRHAVAEAAPPPHPAPHLSAHAGGAEASAAALRDNQVLRLDVDTMRARVHDLELECSAMKTMIQKLHEKSSPVDNERRTSSLRRSGCKFKTQVCDSHEPTVVEGRSAGNVKNKGRNRNR